MTVPSLLPIYEALFQKLQSVSFPPLGVSSLTSWGDVSRRVKHFNDVPREIQPAAYQAEHIQKWQPGKTIALPQRRIVPANWIIYFRTDGGQVGADIQQALMDAINVALAPDDTESNKLTLGRLVEYCRVEGDAWFEPGDLDDQGMMVVPISMVVP